MTIFSVRINEETKKLMEKVKINWSGFVRNAIRKRAMEEERRNLAKAVLITECIRKKSAGEAKAKEIIRKFRNSRMYTADKKHTRGLKPEH